MDPLDGVTVFVMVAQCGGFSAAAEKLGCSKSTISAQITRLERRIGARLLRRSSRSISLTDAGRAYLCQVDDVLDRVRQAEKAAQAEAQEARGVLRVSAPGPFASTHLAPLLPEFMSLNPKITIDLQVTPEVVDLVTAGFDLAIRLCPVNDPASVVRRLGGTRLVVAASPDLFKRRATPQMPEDLANVPCLVNSLHPWHSQWRFRCGEEERSIRVQPIFVANSLEVLHRLVRAGAGVAMLSEYAVMEDLKGGRLVRLLTDWQIIDIPVLAVYPDNRQIAAKVRTFVDFLARRLDPGTLMEIAQPKPSQATQMRVG
jgi:DNA-binding transcriptional LysR family regulator